MKGCVRWSARLAFILSVGIPGHSMPENSGVAWCYRFRVGPEISLLSGEFGPKVREFVDALREAGASVQINSTLRPPQRQYLMHWSWRIARERYWFHAARPCTYNGRGMPSTWWPSEVPGFDGKGDPVEIIWRWSDGRWVMCVVNNSNCNCPYHRCDFTGAVQAAADMFGGYNIVDRPARQSKHNRGTAVDMNITWSGNLIIANKDRSIITITSSPRNGNNTDLHLIGATYGVIKLVSDPPHWSDDGH